jgi:hypothetical protein
MSGRKSYREIAFQKEVFGLGILLWEIDLRKRGVPSWPIAITIALRKIF